MDTTKQYLLMCEKANEIQVLRPTESNGDWCNWMGDTKCINVGIVILHKNIIWLPRQDQLQEMIINPLLSNGLINQIKDKLNNFKIEKEVQGKIISMEQYLLLIVMKEKYNKVWNGTDWQKEIK